MIIYYIHTQIYTLWVRIYIKIYMKIIEVVYLFAGFYIYILHSINIYTYTLLDEPLNYIIAMFRC